MAERAKAHYAKGATLYRQNDFAAAWLEFTSAYQLLPKPELLFNMARCEVKLDRPKEALTHFREYLAAIPNDPDAEGIRGEMAALQADVERQQRLEEVKARETAQQPPPPSRRPWPVYGTVAGAATALIGVTSIALLGSVGSQFDYLQGYCSPLCRPEEVSPLQQQATAGYALLGLTAVGVVTTAALLTWELRYRHRERGAKTAAPGNGLSLAWRY